jgi:hypothetical protein
MSITITRPILTYDDLIARAAEVWSSDRTMVFTANTTDAEATRLAARAITAAIDLWCDETGEPHTAVLEATKILAMARVIWLGWDEWEREQQPDLFEDDPIWLGNAAHEARSDLESPV